ncbi:tubulin folding cofactor C [Willisornis vidua]|uniref:Tubulin folding cofactor C n=1 Tax=Willisornis vidua TaxID=1566151 RepID=A0ABQ9CWA1_9PASS|nr:tubulin folding cofactor C [Willisornis vidua]
MCAAVLPERLQRREAERQQGVERQRQKKEAQVVREEQSEFFLAEFGREREAVESLLAAGALEEAAARLQALQKLLTDSVRFLAPYELELGPAELRQRDVLLAGLRGCRVRLRGNPNTLRVRDCRGCSVLCGPVSTSVLVDGCSDCLLALACQQLRTHRSQGCRFYVQVTSRAVIEGCSNVSFAPYAWSYPGIEGDFESSGLNRDSNNWNLVDDFDWLAMDKPSPNWSLIPEQERITCWD